MADSVAKDCLSDADFPALYAAANELSGSAQRSILNQNRVYHGLLITFALAAATPVAKGSYSWLLAILLTISLLFSVFMFKSQAKERWYRARALAESVKTSTWRYVTRTEPYSTALQESEATRRFCSVLEGLLREHSSLAADLGGRAIHTDQVTAKMREIRSFDLARRVEVYLSCRVSDQNEWYRKRARENRRAAFHWFCAIWILHGAAIAFVVLESSGLAWVFWPTNLFVVASVSALAWVELKRYRELAEAYGLTEHEIGLLKSSFGHPSTESDFSKLVDDAENAFSREHTQWLARRNLFYRRKENES